MSHFHKSCETQQAFEDVGHIYFRFPSYGPHLHVAKWVSRHIKCHVQQNDIQNHHTLLLHINDDTSHHCKHGARLDEKRSKSNFDTTSCGERLEESNLHDVLPLIVI